MLVYEKIMSDEEVEDLYGDFYSKDWKDITINPEILSWSEIQLKPWDENHIQATAYLCEDRVYAGVLLRIRGFSVREL